MMKKFLALSLSFYWLLLPVSAYIEDDFVEQTLNQNLEVTLRKTDFLKDEFAENNNNKNSKIEKQNLIIDTFAENNKGKSQISQKVVVTEVLPAIDNSKKVEKRKFIAEDALNQGVKIPIKILANISTKNNLEEGDEILFETVAPVTIKNINYPKGSTVKGRIETVSMNYSLGVPADLVLGNFVLDKTPLKGEIKKIGANRSLWVKPCSIGFLLFFGLGVVFLPIRGGHAKVHTSEVYTMYY